MVEGNYKEKFNLHTVLTLMVLIAQAKSGSILYIWMRKGPPQKFWSHTTIFSLEKLSFSHFLGHENLI